ncbi:carboxymuconolactone decarboxylase family protein [Leisingera sp. ANG59]|uniref:carboxymuconolactone decarboxylase family protein n=1 Tax=Leisingera sp. ANG59 TaxID=2675221 RepID=UPI0015716C3B|nr:carboxymuconolactone decarboxylase family protein [Leisingera sp. ANG59]NSY37206.1 carboxymuconolactone decarboxylase family protein [Leisingera sp. ANG59]
MTPETLHTDTYARGKALSEQVNPGMEEALQARYDALVPGLSRTIVDVAYGQFYTRGTVDEKTRLLATVAALAALGGQTRPQLKVNVASARAVGASREEISEIIFQMALYGGLPSMINALNAAIEVFEAEEVADV